MILQNSRTKGTFFKFQEFSGTKVKFKDFSRSVRTLHNMTDLYPNPCNNNMCYKGTALYCYMQINIVSMPVKNQLQITVCHHSASLVMPNDL